MEIGAWGRFCGQGMLSGSRYYVVARFGDSRALGKVLGPWGKAWLGQKKQAGLGPGGSWCRFVNTTAISFGISSRINHQLAADAETSTAL